MPTQPSTRRQAVTPSSGWPRITKHHWKECSYATQRCRILGLFIIVGEMLTGMCLSVDRMSAEKRRNQHWHWPPYSRLTARLYPWVRSVEALQKMVAGTIKKKPASYGQQSSPLKKIISGADSSYTIQWYAANKPEAVKRMKKRFPRDIKCRHCSLPA